VQEAQRLSDRRIAVIDHCRELSASRRTKLAMKTPEDAESLDDLDNWFRPRTLFEKRELFSL